MTRTRTPRITTAGCPIDFDHLNRYTGGSPDLNQEILKLFDDHCTATSARLEELARADGVGGKAWQELTHTLKGAARGVGAFGVADIAAEAETIATHAAIDVVQRLKEKSSAVHLFVGQLLNSPA
jgi:HPt (histidine-containing phosphotransfer) domain-containing protein